MFRETELDAASITITINAFFDQASYHRPFPERRYWYVPPGKQGSVKVCGTVNSISLIEPRYLVKAGEKARHEPASIDDQPQAAAAAEIAYPVPILDPEFMKMLTHVKRYLLCIALALAAIAMVMLFR
ncbi:MAG: hypothetical protein M3Z14_00525 [Candidatus Eremiobacteraeota bacterium]|nr:hypothetical protein [Candidatus Eremiobacteraeota bacterium]